MKRREKVKKSIKIICMLLLSVMLAVAFTACSEDEVPDGYQLVACEGDKFRLYVPTQWIVNTSGGVTSAYYTSDAEISVGVYVADDAGDLDIDEYWAVCNEKYKSKLDGYVYEGKSEKIILGGKPAQKYIFAAKKIVYDENKKDNVSTDYKFLQVISQNNGETYILIYSAPADVFEDHLETVEGNASDEGIIPYFVFAEPYTSKDNKKEYNEKIDSPDGMKLASANEQPYRFFVPSSWKINNATNATAAYASESDRSNVNVQMYMTSSNTETVADHFEKLQKNYENTFSSYTLISDDEIKIDGVSAHKYTYTLVSGGQEYKVVQAIVRRGEMFYYITYTAIPENFDKHILDVEKMIESFVFRKSPFD